jgi:hemoglobin
MSNCGSSGTRHPERGSRARTAYSSPVRDLETRDDIDALLRAFYTRAMTDPLIGRLFTDVAKLDLEHHLPRIGNFWEQVLLQRPVYVGNPIAAHLPLHAAATLQAAHFQRWFSLWAEAVDGLFAGPMAALAKERAAVIAESMQYRLGVASDEVQFSDAYRAALRMPPGAI